MNKFFIVLFLGLTLSAQAKAARLDSVLCELAMSGNASEEELDLVKLAETNAISSQIIAQQDADVPRMYTDEQKLMVKVDNRTYWGKRIYIAQNLDILEIIKKKNGTNITVPEKRFLRYLAAAVPRSMLNSNTLFLMLMIKEIKTAERISAGRAVLFIEFIQTTNSGQEVLDAVLDKLVP